MTIKPDHEVKREQILQQAFQLGQANRGADSAESELEVRALYADDPEALSAYERGRLSPDTFRLHAGRVVGHGRAHYNNDPKEKKSYFVQLETDKGIETIWGLDLKRAFEKSELQIGDFAKLIFKGKAPVKVQANVRNSEGEVVGKEWKTAERNSWEIAPWNPATEPLIARRNDVASSGAVSDAIFRPSSAGAPQAAQSRPLVGAMGASRLSNMLDVGGRCVRTNIADFAYKRVSSEFDTAVREVGAKLSTLGAVELAGLNDATLDQRAKDKLVSDFFSVPHNKHQFDQLLKDFDRVQTLSQKVISKGLEKGLDGDSLLHQAIAPIHRLMTDHEKLLRGLNQGNGSLYEQVEAAVNGLFKMLRDLLAQAMSLFSPDRNTGPGSRLGA